MEEEKKGGYTAEGRKLRPRRPRVSERVYDANQTEGHHEGGHQRDYDNHQGGYQGRQGGYNGGGREGGYNRQGRQGGYQGGGRSYGNGGGGRDGGYSRQGRQGGYQGGGRNYGNNENREGGYSSDREGSRQGGYQGGGRQGGYNRQGRQGSYNGGGRSYGNGGGSYSQGRGPSRGGYNGGKGGQKGGYGSRPQGPGRGPKPYGKPRQDNASEGISRMVNRNPQVDNTHITDADIVKVPVKEEVRLNKFIANSGVCSRREADLYIQAGVVTVNGEVVTELGTKINTNTDDVRFNGERIQGEEKVYLVMNKPKGFVTTVGDPHAERTIMDLLRGCKYRVFPVGRLDKNTTGVILLTNDGEIAERLTHPSYSKKKIYQVTLDRPLEQADYEKVLSGITLNDGDIKADELEYIDPEDHRKLGIEIHSGRNRIVRRIFESLGYDVKALDRVYFAGLTKKGLKKGEWRFLTKGEANVLKMGAYV